MTSKTFLLSTFLFATLASAQPVTNPGVRVGFNPQPDPPGFGVMPVRAGQSIWLNVVCFEHNIGKTPPDPCHGTFMFHDAAGNTLKTGRYDLKPGQATLLAWTAPAPVDSTNGGGLPFLIEPCMLPESGGVAIPDVEVLDGNTGAVLRHENPAGARLSEFNKYFSNPALMSGFNPQPDPPGFGMVTLVLGQGARLATSCFEHPVNGIPPGPCSGEMMFHNTAGDVLKSSRYNLKPGETAFLDLLPAVQTDARGLVTIIPCFLPDVGGRAVPNVHVVNLSNGDIVRTINPAVARMSMFQQP